MYSGEQSKKWIEDNKDNLIEVFSDLFSKKTGKGDSSKQNHQLKECIKDKKECIKDKKESLKKVFSDLFSKKTGKGDSSKQNHQLEEWIKDKMESLKKVFSDLFSKKEGKGDGEGKLILVCYGINSSRTNYKILWEMYSGK